MPRRKLSPYWLFLCDLARCQGTSAHLLVNSIQADGIWEKLTSEQRNRYTEFTSFILDFHGRDGALKAAKELGYNIFHWEENCQKEQSQCSSCKSVWSEEVDSKVVHRTCIEQYGEEYSLDEYFNEMDIHCPHFQ